MKGTSKIISCETVDVLIRIDTKPDDYQVIISFYETAKYYEEIIYVESMEIAILIVKDLSKESAEKFVEFKKLPF